MISHNELTDKKFILQFENCSLNPSLFSHEAHIRLAWIYIKKYGCQKAEERVQKYLKAFVKHVGATDKYNTTLTIAAIKIVAHFIKKSDKNNFKEFILEHPQLNTNFKLLINSHYSIDIYNSILAKEKYMEPDLKTF
ncbi:hypothetical protein [uncultured Tenacibaculum sp.]|uniref:hypothetical protein n=1 Tax=uncultured Tenacibaculum sp. TaxID=174713 RepID=UPI0026116D6F|nr:hypothetical protein [uncultured Tenacibaculum sp.]